MSRSRIIKPGFFTNDRLAEISPLGRILFAGLWTMADRKGRLEDRPKRIKAEVLPFDNANVDKLLKDLADHGFIVRYQVQGAAYIQIVSFEKHQSPHMREPDSSIPAPPTAPDEHGASMVLAPDETHTSPTFARAPDPDPIQFSSVPAIPPAMQQQHRSESLSHSQGAELSDALYRRVCDSWLTTIGTTLNRKAAERLVAAADRTSEQWVLDAIGVTGAANAKSPNHTLAVIERWEREGRSPPSAPNISKPPPERPPTLAELDEMFLSRPLLPKGVKP